MANNQYKIDSIQFSKHGFQAYFAYILLLQKIKNC